ncbi:MAG: hypothetical protein A2277_02120 [Desulfobacterales bacterium RIFOXYA12_FULL_46_15]|nr:MAG: hypothetical protein A2277_02120 [Desulfobacterales bacterium RIFOXYA12_FULL_46_15]
MIKDDRMGHILSLSDKETWVKKIQEIHILKTEQPNEFNLMRDTCRNHVRDNYSWGQAFDDLLGEGFSGAFNKWDNVPDPIINYGEESFKGVA